jgi:hypothetical protein
MEYSERMWSECSLAEAIHGVAQMLTGIRVWEQQAELRTKVLGFYTATDMT